MAKIMVAYVHPGMVHHIWVTSMFQQISNQNHVYIYNGCGSGPLIARARNKLAYDFYEQKDVDYLLFTDTDNAWQPDDVDKLIARDKPIVGALYRGVNETDQDNRVFHVCLIEEDGVYVKPDWAYIDKWGARNKGLIKVAVVGMGFTLIRREVIDTLKVETEQLWPFAEIISPKTGQAAGEDTTFCERAKDAGFDSYIDSKVMVAHIKPQLV